MSASVGEHLVGAYLKIIEECDFIGYNLRPPGGGLRGLNELDVVGRQFSTSSAYLCEVTTHIRGVLYRNNQETVRRIRKKFKRQQRYAQEHLQDFPTCRFMFWSPVVPVGYLTENLAKIEGLELVINADYAERVDRLRDEAARRENNENNPVFRLLQILEHMRR